MLVKCGGLMVRVCFGHTTFVSEVGIEKLEKELTVYFNSGL